MPIPRSLYPPPDPARVCICGPTVHECPNCRADRVAQRRARGFATPDPATPLGLQLAAIQAAIARGESYVAIARREQMTEKMLYHLLKRHGLHVSRMALRTAQIDAVVPRIMQLRAQGVFFREIARQCGVSQHVVRCVVLGIRQVRR